jgi:peptide deformylase
MGIDAYYEGCFSVAGVIWGAVTSTERAWKCDQKYSARRNDKKVASKAKGILL